MFDDAAVEAWGRRWDEVQSYVAREERFQKRSLTMKFRSGLAVKITGASTARSIIPLAVEEVSPCCFSYLKYFQRCKTCLECNREFACMGQEVWRGELGVNGMMDAYVDLHADFSSQELLCAIQEQGLNVLQAALEAHMVEEVARDAATAVFGLQDRPELAHAR